MNNWFSSDIHLGHRKLHDARKDLLPEGVDHDGYIVNRIFSVVKPGDNYYNIGDLFWKMPLEKKLEFFNLFKKHKVNFFGIYGNHDKPYPNHKAVVWTGHIKDIVIEKQPITLCHYPMMVWNRSHYGAWQLYGHEHLRNKSLENSIPRVDETRRLGKQLNVNVEFHNFLPWSFEEVYEVMKTKNDNLDLLKR